MFRSSVLRASRLASAPKTSSAALLARSAPAAIQSRSASYAVSNVTLADIEKRWESMPPAEQAEVWMQLRDRMKGSWSDLTIQEKKACMFTVTSEIQLNGWFRC
jgi:cytochrome c oxidase subunit 4